MPSPLLNHILLRALRLGPWDRHFRRRCKERLPRFLRQFDILSPGRLNLVRKA